MLNLFINGINSISLGKFYYYFLLNKNSIQCLKLISTRKLDWYQQRKENSGLDCIKSKWTLFYVNLRKITSVSWRKFTKFCVNLRKISMFRFFVIVLKVFAVLHLYDTRSKLWYIAYFVAEFFKSGVSTFIKDFEVRWITKFLMWKLLFRLKNVYNRLTIVNL